ncbi:MAG: response regulator [Planctomycetes bacterium]|nr:response regulator [Planctomycetota bacterium]
MLRKIMIVDDSATARMFTRRCLEITGCNESEFVEAVNGRDALEKLRESAVDLVVSDVTMPEMDGRELVMRIVASPKLNSIPVVVITSAGNPALEEELKSMGVLAVIAKPISPPLLEEALKSLLPEEEY